MGEVNVDAQRLAVGGPELIRNVEPATGRPLPEVEVVPPEGVAAVVDRARAAQPAWNALGFRERRRRLIRFRDLVLERAEELADLVSRENGKPRFEALIHDIVPIADLTGFYARRAARALRPERIRLRFFPHKKSYIRYEPRGVIGIISPWNFPFSIPLGELVPGLAAGNAVVVKPSEYTPLTMLRARELLVEAGIPEHVVGVVPGYGATGAALVESGVDMVTFTGSGRTGSLVAAACGRRLIPCLLELGGKDPAIVCADADLDKAARLVTFGAFVNSGQVCASVERVYVDRRVADEFTQRVVELTRTLRQGADGQGEIDVGAMTVPGQVDIVERHLRDAVSKGATVLTGGSRGTGEGRFFQPTVLANVTHDMAVMREETFGPLLPIHPVDSEDEAIRHANDSEYGLNAYVFSRDRRRAESLANRLQAGTVMINDVVYTHGAPETPWGGVKQSGLGRTHAEQALRDMSWMRHVNTERISMMPIWAYPYSESTRRGLLRVVRTFLRFFR